MIDERADSDWANLKAVAPFTGAWIEILRIIKYVKNGSCRTLHGCVD